MSYAKIKSNTETRDGWEIQYEIPDNTHVTVVNDELIDVSLNTGASGPSTTIVKMTYVAPSDVDGGFKLEFSNDLSVIKKPHLRVQY